MTAANNNDNNDIHQRRCNICDKPKPSEIYEMIESMFPQRKYIELFARGSDKREGWKTWGLEASTTATAGGGVEETT